MAVVCESKEMRSDSIGRWLHVNFRYFFCFYFFSPPPHSSINLLLERKFFGGNGNARQATRYQFGISNNEKTKIDPVVGGHRIDSNWFKSLWLFLFAVVEGIVFEFEFVIPRNMITTHLVQHARSIAESIYLFCILRICWPVGWPVAFIWNINDLWISMKYLREYNF